MEKARVNGPIRKTGGVDDSDGEYSKNCRQGEAH